MKKILPLVLFVLLSMCFQPVKGLARSFCCISHEILFENIEPGPPLFKEVDVLIGWNDGTWQPIKTWGLGQVCTNVKICWPLFYTPFRRCTSDYSEWSQTVISQNCSSDLRSCSIAGSLTFSTSPHYCKSNDQPPPYSPWG